MRDPGLSARELCAYAGITYRQLDNWVVTKVLDASVHPSTGSGSPRRFSTDDARTARRVAILLEQGMSLDAIRKHLHVVRSYDGGLLLMGSRSATVVTLEQAPAAMRDLGHVVVVASFQNEPDPREWCQQWNQAMANPVRHRA